MGYTLRILMILAPLNSPWKTLQNDIIFTQGFHQEDEYAIIDITENKQVNSITIFPNPTQDELHINFETKGDYASLSIKDITGSTMSFLSDFSLLVRDAIL